MLPRLLISFFLLLSLQGLGQVDESSLKLGDSITLKLERSVFDSADQKIEYFQGKFVIAINGRSLFGSDGEIPRFKLTKVTLIIGKKNYNLQVDDMFNPWFGLVLNKSLFKIKKEGTNYKLYGLFSDGAGSYAAEWLITGNSSIRTILSNDEELIMGYFKKNMK